jgi:hypothetical protein
MKRGGASTRGTTASTTAGDEEEIVMVPTAMRLEPFTWAVA